MKLKITMKDPDGVYESIRKAALDSTKDIQGINALERKSLCEQRQEKLSDITQQWIWGGEYLTIEIDTETKTCTVIESK